MGNGGVPELTGVDVAAALGFTPDRIGNKHIGVHLVMAKYADDAHSLKILKTQTARIAWSIWYDLGLKGRVTRSQIERIADVALKDFTEPGKFKGITKTHLAEMVRIDIRTWNRGYGKVYSELLDRLEQYEQPVYRALFNALSR